MSKKTVTNYLLICRNSTKVAVDRNIGKTNVR